jgi:hypothetical protein
VIIQFIRPSKNQSGDETHSITTRYTVPDEVGSILKVACNDCHTNTTRYPWYSHVQPVGWFLASHVTNGKKHLNLSEFTSRKLAIQHHKFEEIIELVEEKEMPLPSYTWLGMHPDARLSDAQRKTITDWARTQMDMLSSTYPPDSLILRRG